MSTGTRRRSRRWSVCFACFLASDSTGSSDLPHARRAEPLALLWLTSLLVRMVGTQMFVAGEIQDPLPETVRFVEDVVRGQVIELVRCLPPGSLPVLVPAASHHADHSVTLTPGMLLYHSLPCTAPGRLFHWSISQATRARLLALRRSSRTLAPEDLIFLIRHDRAKVNRLRTYLSWKDVRKNAKDSEGAPGGGAGGGGGGAGDDEVGEADGQFPFMSPSSALSILTGEDGFLLQTSFRRKRGDRSSNSRGRLRPTTATSSPRTRRNGAGRHKACITRTRTQRTKTRMRWRPTKIF